MTEDNTFLIFVKLMIGQFYYELPTSADHFGSKVRYQK